MNVLKLKSRIAKMADKKRARVLQGFFKTGKGEYGEGDVFVGITVPQLRALSKEFESLSLRELGQLIQSRVHEERLCALFILVRKYEKGDDAARKQCYDFYVRYMKYVNNWDLVDLSSYKIVGPYLADNNREILCKWAESENLWTRRIAIMATFHFIKKHEYEDTLKISRILLKDKEDLMHKAAGWMLREIGKRDLGVEERFLKQHYKKMPRTMLRYAIERFDEDRRQSYLKGTA